MPQDGLKPIIFPLNLGKIAAGVMGVNGSAA